MFNWCAQKHDTLHPQPLHRHCQETRKANLRSLPTPLGPRSHFPCVSSGFERSLGQLKISALKNPGSGGASQLSAMKQESYTSANADLNLSCPFVCCRVRPMLVGALALFLGTPGCCLHFKLCLCDCSFRKMNYDEPFWFLAFFY